MIRRHRPKSPRHARVRVPGGRTASRGFTLIELLLVLFIIGLGWFSLLPNLDFASRYDEVDKHAAINAFMDEVRNAALEQYADQKIGLVLGKDVMKWGEESVALPGTVAKCTVNRRPPEGMELSFYVYREGIMDEVVLTLSNGEVLTGHVLLAHF